MESFETLLYEEEDGVAVVTLNRPEVLNAFNDLMQAELQRMWGSVRMNPDVRAIVITGAGDEAFCTGIDRAETITRYLANPDTPQGTGRAGSPFLWDDPGKKINPKQCGVWKPVIAAVNGMACAGALYMLGEADIVIAVEHATFFDPHVSYGMVAGIESVHLLQKLPLGETLRVALLGANERMSAARAHQLGLVSEVVAPGELMERALWVARSIAAAPPLAVQGTLRAVWMAHEIARKEALEQVPSLVLLGTKYENIEAGEQAFQGEHVEWRLR